MCRMRAERRRKSECILVEFFLLRFFVFDFVFKKHEVMRTFFFFFLLMPFYFELIFFSCLFVVVFFSIVLVCALCAELAVIAAGSRQHRNFC